jgi:hypothetical protein
MPRWVWAVLLLAVSVYGWRRAEALRARGPDEIVAVNRTGRDLDRLTITVAGRRVGAAPVAAGATVRFPLRGDRDGRFRLEWRTREPGHEVRWDGGRFTHGPIAMRHRFELIRGDGVVWRSQRLPARAAR